MDILLTDEEIEEAEVQGVTNYRDSTPEEGQFLDEEILAAQRSICHAQVRKVAEWLETNSIDTWEPATQTYTMRSQSMLVWEVLKAAGEGK